MTLARNVAVATHHPATGNPRRSIVRAGLFAFVAGFATLGALADFSSRAAAQELQMQDPERWKTLPLIAVIRSGTAQIAGTLTYSPREPRSKLAGKTPIAALEDLDPEMRRLTWLMFFQSGWVFRDDTEWLHTFFFLENGNFAPDVRDALKRAGLSAQYQIFSDAMASFGPHYPLAHDERKRFFAWWRGSERPLTALDRKLMALSKTFGSRSDYEAAVEGYVRASPTLMHWAQEMRPKVSDRERLDWLMEQLHWHVGADGPASQQRLSALPTPCQQLLYLGTLCGEVYNGGVEQFFSNSSGDVAPAVARTLQDVGLGKEAEIVRQGIDLFPAPYPVDRQRRQSLLTGVIDKKLYDLDVDSVVVRRAMIEVAKREKLLPQ
jgi:Domain of unknown function (DUF4375)